MLELLVERLSNAEIAQRIVMWLPLRADGLPAQRVAGFEHCCCGKVHFAGLDAGQSLSAYLADRAARRRREPAYERGETTIDIAGKAIAEAWAFPVE